MFLRMKLQNHEESDVNVEQVLQVVHDWLAMRAQQVCVCVCVCVC
jgi:hypothetical protein